MYQNRNPFFFIHAVVIFCLGACLLTTAAFAQEDEPPVITSDPITTGLVGELYTYDVDATGSPRPRFLLIVAPEGMDIDNETGEITWTPTEEGEAEVAIVASNGVLPIATQSFTIVVSGDAPAFTSLPVTTVEVGSIYIYDVNATGNPEPTYALLEAPEDMNIDEVSGIISWISNDAGTFEITVVASNGTPPDATQSFSLEVTGDGPVFTSIPITTVAFGETYEYDAEASGDPAPTYVLETAPDGMTIDSISGLIFWTPTEVGMFDVLVIASNGAQTDASQAFTVEVTGIPPAITTSPVTTVALGSTYNYDVNAKGNPQQTFSLDEAPEGMGIDPKSGMIIWEPDALGSFDVMVIATNGVGPDAVQSFTIEVTGIAPVITSIPVDIGYIGSSYTYTVDATGTPDPTFDLISAPAGMEIDPSTGIISWEPSKEGTFSVEISASNGVEPGVVQSFTLTISPEIEPPIFTSAPLTQAIVNQRFTYDVNAFGNPSPTYSLAASPTGMTIDPLSGLITWIPTAEGTFSVTVIASNGASVVATQSFSIEATSGFFAPIMTSSPLTLAAIGETYSYKTSAIGNPSPSYSLATAPPGMTIDPVSGVISWTPATAGTYDVTITAFNGIGQDASQSFSLNATAENFAPVIRSSPLSIAQVNQLYTYQVNAIGNPIPTYAFVAAPDGMSIDPISGVISWTPSASGDYEVIVAASNNEGEDALQAYTLTVTQGQFAPIITSNPPTITAPNQTYSYQVTAIGNPSPTFTIDAPPGITIDSQSGVISWTPSEEGAFEVFVMASNGLLPDDTQPFTLVVTNASFAPTITSIPLTTATINAQYVFDLEATGNPAPTFTLGTAPFGMTIHPTSGIINWLPTSLGDFEVSVQATNGVTPNASKTFMITVGAPVHIVKEEFEIESFEVGQNYPNPFVSSTTIEYSLPAADHVYISIYDALGRRVSVLENTYHNAGRHRVAWNGRDQRGSNVPAGVYFVKVQVQSGETHIVSMLKLD